MTQLLQEIFNLCIVPMIGILLAYVARWLNAKRNYILTSDKNDTEKKYLTQLLAIVENCVKATNQNYVDTLKQDSKFDRDAQEAALAKTFSAVLEVISDDMKKVLTEVIGDLDIYIIELIEAKVGEFKLQK